MIEINKEKLKSGRLKDLCCHIIFVAVYIIIVLISTRGGKYIFGSLKDFSTQHYVLPDYLRTLFYENHDLFPDFAFNLGGGQNIYNISYYGLLNPIILISYLLPFVDMLDYIIVAMAVVVLSSVSLFYFYLRKNGYTQRICFVCSFAFLCAVPFIFHAHRHIMFIDYMPFLIMGFYGVDRLVYKNKSWLLMLSVALMIFTSYYFSISGIIVLILFACFKYVRKNGFAFKELFGFILKLSVRFIAPVLISGVLILPTFYAIISGRSDSTSSTTLLELLFGQGMLYGNYTMGLTLIVVVAAVYMLFKGMIESRILSGILLLFAFVPFFNYALNGFLYVNAKSLIPFVPLALVNLADFLPIALDFRYKKISCKKVLTPYLIIVSLTLCISVNLTDSLMTQHDGFKLISEDYKNSVQKITDKDSSYRINSALISERYINKVIDTREYTSTMYSSTFNSGYREWYRDTANAPLNYRNEFIISASNDLLLQSFLGEKYIYSKAELPSVYKKIESFSDITLYENLYALPIGYATSAVINSDDFAKIDYPQNILNMLGRAVTEGKTTAELIAPQKLESCEYTVISKDAFESEKTDSGYTLETEDDTEIKLELNNPDLKNKLLIISFAVTPQEEDLTVTINETTNKLTDKTWKYYNRNTKFAFVIFNEDNQLDISLGKGRYEITDIKAYCLDTEILSKLSQDIDPFVIDSGKTKGDVISGNITVKEDGYFMLSVPYDEGFTVKVDGKNTEYYKANGAFIGFDISSGEHTVEIEYQAPLKKEGIYLSICGLLIFVGVIFFERKRKNGKDINNSSLL